MYVQPRKVGNVREEGNGTHFRGHVDSSRKLGQGRVMGSYIWPPTWAMGSRVRAWVLWLL